MNCVIDISEKTRQMVQDLVDAILRHEKTSYAANNEIIAVPKRVIPKGAKLVECYETDKEYVVLGRPDPNDETHNCDALGCSTMSHVVARFPKLNVFFPCVAQLGENKLARMVTLAAYDGFSLSRDHTGMWLLHEPSIAAPLMQGTAEELIEKLTK